MNDKFIFQPEAFPGEVLFEDSPETSDGETEWGELEEERRMGGAPRFRQGFSARRRMQGRPAGRMRAKPRARRPLRRPWPRRRPLPRGPFVIGQEPASGGAGGEYVRWTQDCLNRVMSTNLPADGTMSPATRSLIRRFQQQRGIRPTGIMGPETEEALKRACAGGGASAAGDGQPPADGGDAGGADSGGADTGGADAGAAGGDEELFGDIFNVNSGVSSRELTMHEMSCQCRRCGGGRVASSESEAEFSMSEAEEMDLALELLTVSSEAELDQFLGKLVKGAWKGIKKVGSVVGKIAKPLGGVLKAVAKKALPFVGGALGSFIPIPGVGTAVGSALGGALAKALEAETEGLELEERELEMARRFVRIATTAARQAAASAPYMDAEAAVNQAVVAAARRQLPQLQLTGTGGQGRWVRSGQQIVVLGA